MSNEAPNARETIYFNGALITDHMHTTTSPFVGGHEYVRVDVCDALVAEEIANRDAMEEAFSKAYTLAMGKPLEWSSVYAQDEALADMEEQLASDGAEIECKAWNAAIEAAFEKAEIHMLGLSKEHADRVCAAIARLKKGGAA